LSLLQAGDLQKPNKKLQKPITLLLPFELAPGDRRMHNPTKTTETHHSFAAF
jgi:hypothetical protein